MKKKAEQTMENNVADTTTTEQSTTADIKPNPEPTTEATTAQATTEDSTTEEPTTEEPTLVGITARYKGDKVPKGSEIQEYGIDITEIYSDGSTKSGEFHENYRIDISENYTIETTIDGKEYHTCTVTYLGITAPLKVEMIDVGNTPYPIQFMAQYKGEAIKRGDKPSLDDISTNVVMSDYTYSEADISKLYVCTTRIMYVPYE